MNIRNFTKSDLNNLYSTLSDSDVMKYIEPPYSFEKTEGFLNDVALADHPLIYAVEDDSGNYIGYVIYHDYDEESKELGWLLNKQEWGKGYASTLTKLMIEMTRKAKKDAVIECDPEQTVTRHIAEKFGFVYEGNVDGCDVFRLKHHENV